MEKAADSTVKTLLASMILVVGVASLGWGGNKAREGRLPD